MCHYNSICILASLLNHLPSTSYTQYPFLSQRSAVAWWLMPRTPDAEVGASSPTRVKPCCVLEQGTFTPKSILAIPRKRWLRPNMTETLFTGTLRINQPTNQPFSVYDDNTTETASLTDNATAENKLCLVHIGTEYSPITKTCPCNVLQCFNAVKMLNFQMKNCDIFLIFAQNIDCGYTLEPRRF